MLALVEFSSCRKKPVTVEYWMYSGLWARATAVKEPRRMFPRENRVEASMAINIADDGQPGK